jgi:hypothetical protein
VDITMSWTFPEIETTNPQLRRYACGPPGERRSVGDVMHGLATDPTLRAALNEALARAPFPAFRWETPAVTAATLSRPFEFVLLSAPQLARRADPATFAEHFRAGEVVVQFASLGRDALLIAPCPTGDLAPYAHLGAFVREAPAAQRDAFWRQVGEAMSHRVGSRPVWLNTEGGGVAWLHVRLDDRPKYYGHAPYRAPR